jgi:hypothetical protein
VTLEERLDSTSEPWKPSPGDKLVGTVVDIDERDAGYGSYPVVTVLDDTGAQWAFHAYHTVAKSELAKARPVVGDRIGVKYLGRHEGKQYEAYKVTVARDEARQQLDWERIGAESTAEQHQDATAEDSVHADEDPGTRAADDIPF